MISIRTNIYYLPMLSPVSGDVAGGSIVRHLLPLVMTMVMMAVVSSPVRLGKRIGPERNGDGWILMYSEKTGSALLGAFRVFMVWWWWLLEKIQWLARDSPEVIRYCDHNLPIEGLDGSILREQLLPRGVCVAQDTGVERMPSLILAPPPANGKIKMWNYFKI